MPARSLVASAGLQSRSAMAAIRGQMRESTVSAVTYSAHMVPSPPRTSAFCSGVRSASLLPGTSVRGPLIGICVPAASSVPRQLPLESVARPVPRPYSPASNVKVSTESASASPSSTIGAAATSGWK